MWTETQYLMVLFIRTKKAINQAAIESIRAECEHWSSVLWSKIFAHLAVVKGVTSVYLTINLVDLWNLRNLSNSSIELQQYSPIISCFQRHIWAFLYSIDAQLFANYKQRKICKVYGACLQNSLLN